MKKIIKDRYFILKKFKELYFYYVEDWNDSKLLNIPKNPIFYYIKDCKE